MRGTAGLARDALRLRSDALQSNFLREEQARALLKLRRSLPAARDAADANGGSGAGATEPSVDRLAEVSAHRSDYEAVRALAQQLQRSGHAARRVPHATLPAGDGAGGTAAGASRTQTTAWRAAGAATGDAAHAHAQLTRGRFEFLRQQWRAQRSARAHADANADTGTGTDTSGVGVGVKAAASGGGAIGGAQHARRSEGAQLGALAFFFATGIVSACGAVGLVALARLSPDRRDAMRAAGERLGERLRERLGAPLRRFSERMRRWAPRALSNREHGALHDLAHGATRLPSAQRGSGRHGQ